MTAEPAEVIPMPGASPKPRTVRRRLFNRVCPECSGHFQAGRDSLFCSVAHKDSYWNRMGKRGKVAMPFLLAQRAGRTRVKGKPGPYAEVARYAQEQLTALADMWIAEDREAGRRPAFDIVARKMALGWRVTDLAGVVADHTAARKAARNQED